jgi:hypothetical protein
MNPRSVPETLPTVIPQATPSSMLDGPSYRHEPIVRWTEHWLASVRADAEDCIDPFDEETHMLAMGCLARSRSGMLSPLVEVGVRPDLVLGTSVGAL